MNAGIGLSPTEEDSRLPTVFPTLVVGVGGTGVKTLRYLRRRLKDEFGARIVDEPPLVQLLGVDTVPLENRSSVEALHHHEYAYLGGFNAKRVIENLDNFPEIKSWWDWDTKRGLPLGFISTGAKQLRTIGRLAFYRRFHSYNSRIETQIDQLKKIQAHQDTHRQGRPSQDQVYLPHVFVVASLAGGTGSGAFLDIACHLRNRLENQARVIGVLVMPSVFSEDIPSLLQQRRIRANSYAALMELDYFQSGGKFTTKFPHQKPFTLDGGIFDNVFLLDRPNVTGFQLSRQSDVQQMIADAIFEMSVTPTAGHIWESDVNILRERGQDGKILAYSAMGFSSMAVDERSRYDLNLRENAYSVWGAAVGWGYGASVAAEAERVNLAIDQLAADVGRNITADKADVGKEYQSKMRDECHKLILEALRTNINQWGIEGAKEFVNTLTNTYRNILDRDGRRQQEELDAEIGLRRDELRHTQRGNIRRFIDTLNNTRGQESQDEDLIRGPQAALYAAQAKRDTFSLIQNAVAPDLNVLLGSLTQELELCRLNLDRVGQDLTVSTALPLDSYPLRTLLPYEFSGPSANGNAPDETAVRREATTLMGKWVSVSDSAAYDSIISWNYGEPADAQFEILGAARRLTQAMAEERTSLYGVLANLAGREPEKAHDLLRDFIRRCVPYCRLDFDYHNFSEKNVEPSYWLCMSADLKKEFNRGSELFWALSSGDHEFKPADKPGRVDRMHALAVAHGYPVNVFADLPLMFAEYISEDLGQTPLHLQCCWRWQMPLIHAATKEDRDLMKSRDHLFRRLCKNCAQWGRSSGSNQPPTTPPDPQPKRPTDFG